MSITDELRAWANGNSLRAGMSLRTARDQALAIADRIDAEHEREMDEQYKSLTVDMKPMTYENMAADGWIRLPKDADGEYIHIGDVMEGKGYDGTTLLLEVEAVGDGTFFAWRKEDNRWLRHNASRFRHYYAPTIEDVLRELVGKAQALSCIDAEDELVTEYSKLLTLACEDE